jgi:uncharacterized RDD family membrane protein YckC
MRVLARFLDIVILIVIGLIIGAIVGGGSATVSSGTGDGIGRFLVAAILGLIVGFLYDAVMTKTKGGTPMKLAFGMRVVRADDGSPVEWKHAIIRWAIPGVFTIVPILGGIVALVVVIVSLVFIFTKPLRQAVWDQVAGTIVVKAS